MAYVVHSSLTNSQLSPIPARRQAVRRGNVFSRLVAGFRRWRHHVREREVLASLTERELADFGANSADVYQELSRPIWILPPL